MSGPRISVLFDDGCALCRTQVRRLQRWDWRQRLEFVPLTDPRARQLAPGLDQEALLSQIHCVDFGGRIVGGARCLRLLGVRIPLLAPVALGLWIPGALWVADRLYRWLSRHRHAVSRVCGCR
jgi:predicted DCC family thiol-disulfide oxidoreductase YuxK